MVHLVIYELAGYRSTLDSHRFAPEIRDISGVWCSLSDGQWLVETELSAQAVAERLAPLAAQGDSLFVARIYADWSCCGLTDEQLTWLNARNFYSAWELIVNILPLPTLDKTAFNALGKAMRLAK